MINQRLKQFQGPILDIPPIECEEIKFSGRNRLYIGNLSNDVNEEELRELFKTYGEISEAFINADKNFAFIKVDYHINAEKAKKELDGRMRKNRPLRVRFAPNATAIKIKNLTPWISNELLYRAFEVFGQIERAVIIVDDRGKPTGEGVVEYVRKASATAAMRHCQEKCFFLTSSLRPCVVEPFEHNDDTDGYPEKSLMKKSQDFYKARQVRNTRNLRQMIGPSTMWCFCPFSYPLSNRWAHVSPKLVRSSTNTAHAGSSCTNCTNKRPRR
jgi:splicing factor, proline- and glutamine-rich